MEEQAGSLTPPVFVFAWRCRTCPANGHGSAYEDPDAPGITAADIRRAVQDDGCPDCGGPVRVRVEPFAEG